MNGARTSIARLFSIKKVRQPRKVRLRFLFLKTIHNYRLPRIITAQTNFKYFWSLCCYIKHASKNVIILGQWNLFFKSSILKWFFLMSSLQQICHPIKTRVYRSSYQGCSMQKGVLRNFTKFAGKDLCQSLFFNKVAGLPVHFWKLYRNKFKLNFYFHTSLWCLFVVFYEGLKGTGVFLWTLRNF